MCVNFDVLMIFDVFDCYGFFVIVVELLYKIFVVLSYMIQKLESDLNIVLLDCFGYWVKFIDIGWLMLEKG